MADRPAPSALVRFASLIVLVGGVLIGIVDVVRAFAVDLLPGEGISTRLALMMDAVGVTLGFVALAAILQGVAVLMEKRDQAAEPSPGGNGELLGSLDQIRNTLEQLPANLSSLSSVNSDDRSPHHPASSIPSDLTKAMEKMVVLLEEVRDAAMLDESQRHARQRALRDRRKAGAIAEAATAIDSRQWGKADKLIAGLEADFPTDPAIAGLHRRLLAGRKAAEGEAIAEIRGRVEDLMAISSWDEAYQLSAEFAENFPENEEGAALLARVKQERELFNESTVHQLYEDIKADLERRRWRRALAGAQRLLDRYPEHRKTSKIRAQLKTVQENAEIEERQEQEARIQELIRAKRFAEAIELAEDLLDRFPLSPQAESLEDLLPKMRDLAMHQDIDAEAAQQNR